MVAEYGQQMSALDDMRIDGLFWYAGSVVDWNSEKRKQAGR